MATNNQAYEMYVAGYQFLVLNNLFMNHWGLQVLFSLHQSLSFNWTEGKCMSHNLSFVWLMGSKMLKEFLMDLKVYIFMGYPKQILILESIVVNGLRYPKNVTVSTQLEKQWNDLETQRILHNVDMTCNPLIPSKSYVNTHWWLRFIVLFKIITFIFISDYH